MTIKNPNEVNLLTISKTYEIIGKLKHGKTIKKQLFIVIFLKKASTNQKSQNETHPSNISTFLNVTKGISKTKYKETPKNVLSYY